MAAVALAALAGHASPAKADEQLLMRMQFGELTPEMAEFIGANGKLTEVATETPKSLREVVQAICGDAPDAFVRALQVANDDNSLDYSQILQPQAEIAMPPCPPRPAVSLFARQVEPGDNFWKYHEESGLRQLPAIAQYDAAPATSPGAGTFSAFPIRENAAQFRFDPAGGNATGLNPDFDFSRPSAMGTGQFAGANDFQAALKQLGLAAAPYSDGSGKAMETALGVDLPSNSFSAYLKAIEAANPGYGSVDRLQPGEVWLVPDIKEQEYALPLNPTAANSRVAALTPQDVSAATATSVSATTLSTDIRMMTRVEDASCVADGPRPRIGKNLRDIMAENWSHAGDAPREPPRIVIVDSGVYDVAALPGRPTLIRPIRSGRVSIFHDAPAEKDIKPYEHMPNHMHGTNVAALALGGEPAASEAYEIGYREMLQPFRAFYLEETLAVRANGKPIITDGNKKSQAAFYHFDRDSVLDAISYSGRDIVNLSLGRSALFQEITLKSGPLSPTLFVAAAGNEHSNLDLASVYPAAQGGSAATNVITVASVDGNRGLSNFSNWGVDYVDIAAPGCDVTTLSYNADDRIFFEDVVSGTSFSAPQVTWVAAMLRAVRPQQPASLLKMRILAGADIVPALAGRIAEGRVLNPYKALALHDDVIDVGSGDQRRLVFGRILGDRSPARFCADEVDLKGADLLKIAPRFDGNGARPESTRLYFASPTALVKSLNCQPTAFGLSVRTDDAGSVEEIAGDEINDITFAWD